MSRIIQRALYLTVVGALLLTAHQARAELGSLVSKTKVGDPSWEPVDFHLFSGPLEVNSFADIGPLLNSLLPGPNHAPHPDLGVGPGAAHAPPYDSELGEGIVNVGIEEKNEFTSSEFANGQGVYWSWMNIPAADPVMGSSPDFANGPIIPNDDFPITTVFHVDQDGQPFEEPDAGTGMVPALDMSLNPPFDVDGHSHYPQFFIDGYIFSVDPSRGRNGLFEYRASQRDSSGTNGWDIAARFRVVPEPSTLCAVAVGLFGLLGCARSRRIVRSTSHSER